MKYLLLTLITMSSFSELDGMILRDTNNPPLTNKGSELTYGEFDGNFVELYNVVQDIVSGENVTAYDNAATYDAYSTDVYEQFASYNNRIWKAVYAGSPSSFSGVTPAEGPYWTQVSLAQMLPNIMALAEYAAIRQRTPRLYVALLEQTGTNAPVATELENSLGTVTFSYSGNGVYEAITSGLFTDMKTFVLTSQGDIGSATFFSAFRRDNNTVRIETYDQSGTAADDLLIRSHIEIRVYP